MRDPARIPHILEAIRKHWEKQPDLRLGQLIYNLAAPVDRCPGLFYIEDEMLVSRIKPATGGEAAS